MSACCVSGCKNRHSSSSKLKFYRIPSGSRPFQANRRRLWLQAIRQVTGSSPEEIRGNARVCGAHFISQEASMEHDSPDFVPSVFPCIKHRKVKRKRQCREAGVKTEGKRTPSGRRHVSRPVDLQSSAVMEEQTPSAPSAPKEGETLTAEAETETTTTSSPKKASPSKAPAGILNLHRMNPIVLLKHVFVPAGGYKCEQCDQNFPNIPQLMKHKQLLGEEDAKEEDAKEEDAKEEDAEERDAIEEDAEEEDAEEEDAEEEDAEEEDAIEEDAIEEDAEEEEEEKSSPFICEMCGKLFTSRAHLSEHRCEPSFPCNMCDRAFATSHNLKRHKLQHVKDGRKCRECGVLFCKRHKHVLFLPLPKSTTEYEDDSSAIERRHFSMMPGSLQEKPSQTREPPPPALLKPHTVSRLPPPVPRVKDASSQFKPPPCDRPASFARPLPPQHPELPASLKLFSPQHLTSALLEVKRNYEYILSKPRAVEENIVREEPCALPLISPGERTVAHIRQERTAYDLEIVI